MCTFNVTALVEYSVQLYYICISIPQVPKRPNIPICSTLAVVLHSVHQSLDVSTNAKILLPSTRALCMQYHFIPMFKTLLYDGASINFSFRKTFLMYFYCILKVEKAVKMDADSFFQYIPQTLCKYFYSPSLRLISLPFVLGRDSSRVITFCLNLHWHSIWCTSAITTTNSKYISFSAFKMSGYLLCCSSNPYFQCISMHEQSTCRLLILVKKLQFPLIVANRCCEEWINYIVHSSFMKLQLLRPFVSAGNYLWSGKQFPHPAIFYVVMYIHIAGTVRERQKIFCAMLVKHLSATHRICQNKLRRVVDMKLMPLSQDIRLIIIATLATVLVPLNSPVGSVQILSQKAHTTKWNTR